MRSLAFMLDPRMGGRVWSGARHITPGPTRTMQLYQVPEETDEPGVTRQTQFGSDFTPAHYTATPPYPSKHPVASFFISDPSIWQSTFKVHWEDMFGMSANLKEGTRRWSPLGNPAARGRAEGQAIMPYNPWPSGSMLAPQYPASELKAI